MTNLAPLSKEEIQNPKKQKNPVTLTLIDNIPDDAIINFRPSGNPTARYDYFGRAGNLESIICRYDEGNAKRFVPYTYWIDSSTNKASWQAKGLDKLYPLYNLQDLLNNSEKSIVICEGEKSAEAAKALLPDYVVVTSAFGSNSAGKTDFSPLENKHIIIWIDNDAAGLKYSESIKSILSKIGIKSLKITTLDSSKNNGWDAADALAEGWDTNKAKAFIDNAHAVKLEAILPEHFTSDSKGIFYQKDLEQEPAKVCQRINIISQMSDKRSENHGIIIGWESGRTKHQNVTNILMKDIHSDINRVISNLADKGFQINPSRGNKERFAQFLAGVKSPYFKTNVQNTGWNENHYVLPDQIFPQTDEVILLADTSLYSAISTSGNLEDWQNNIGIYAKDNSLIIFALSLAFAASVMQLVDEQESGGFHIIGNSSIGKSTILAVAASVWGNPKFVKQWRTTGNALEAIAETHKDSLLILDELGQVDGKIVGDAIYMLANNQGKARMRNTAELKKTYRWILLFLSSGEVTLEEKMAEADKQFKAGMDVRFINLDAKMSEEFGVFQTIHDLGKPALLSRHLKDSCSKYYGSPIRAFLQKITEDLSEHSDYLKSQIKHFLKDYCANIESGEVSRVQHRFALVAAAGELAIKLGILPLNEGDALYAANNLFNSWFIHRDGAEKLEENKILNQVKEYLIKYGETKFAKLHSSETTLPRERIGWKEELKDDTIYYIPPVTYKSDICAGFNQRHVTQVLQKYNCLELDSSSKPFIQKKIPEMNKNMRVYAINGNIFELN